MNMNEMTIAYVRTLMRVININDVCDDERNATLFAIAHVIYNHRYANDDLIDAIDAMIDDEQRETIQHFIIVIDATHIHTICDITHMN